MCEIYKCIDPPHIEFIRKFTRKNCLNYLEINNFRPHVPSKCTWRQTWLKLQKVSPPPPSLLKKAPYKKCPKGKANLVLPWVLNRRAGSLLTTNATGRIIFSIYQSFKVTVSP
jgi:hypothetical protein